MKSSISYSESIPHKKSGFFVRSFKDEEKQMPNYYDEWRTDSYECPDCEWQGLGGELAYGEQFAELFEVDCPSCGRTITVVTFPTIEESKANWEKVSPEDRRMVLAREQFLNYANVGLLEGPSQLPDIPEDDIILVWDMVDAGDRDYHTVIRYGQQVIWREVSYYEGIDRYLEVLEILKQKYGTRLKDLVTAERSMNHLYGDKLSAPDWENKARDLLWDKAGMKPRPTNVREAGPVPLILQGEPVGIAVDEILFVWDEFEVLGDRRFFVRFGSKTIWEERCNSSCHKRFRAIAGILQNRYGSRLKDLIPTRRTCLECFSKDLNCWKEISTTRGDLWMNGPIST